MSLRTRRRRRVLAVLAGVVTAFVGWGAWAYAVVQTPRLDQPGPVDAVLVLGGLTGPQRTQKALDLVRAGLTDTVVLSIPVGSRDTLARRTCARPPAGVTVQCFDPNPSTTRGEARELERLAEQGHWTRVAVVTSNYHVSRSRMIIGRCFRGTLVMLKSDESIPLWESGYQWLYQAGAYAKAQVLRGC